MQASRVEFRLRMLIMVALIALGFWAPWIEPLGSSVSFARRITSLEWLSLELSRAGIMPFTTATALVIVAGASTAALGAVLRVWGSAYLGYGTVHNSAMEGAAMMADGPYRYLRNPLYVGGWFMTVAMALIMPPTGALFAVTLMTVFFLRLILAEEAFLTATLGDPYRAYVGSVPRLLPRLHPSVAEAHQRPHWLTALLTEINPIGVFVTIAFLSWSYNHWLMLRGILISFGVSLVVRALMPQTPREPTPAA